MGVGKARSAGFAHETAGASQLRFQRFRKTEEPPRQAGMIVKDRDMSGQLRHARNLRPQGPLRKMPPAQSAVRYRPAEASRISSRTHWEIRS